jgi:prevent-host-death family protein
VRANFGKLLDRVADERGSLVIEKRGIPKAVLLSIRDYVKLAAPEPEVLRIIGEESKPSGTDKMTQRQIDGTRSFRPQRLHRIDLSCPHSRKRCGSSKDEHQYAPGYADGYRIERFHSIQK